MIKRILLAFKLFRFGLCQAELFSESIFVCMSKLMEFLFKTASEDRPLCTYIHMGEKRIISLWAFPGVSKNPVDRIAELLKEIDELKQMANQSLNADGANDRTAGREPRPEWTG